jgi:hypothetical protein
MQGRMVLDALSSLFGDRIMMVRLLTFALKHVLRLAGRIAKALERRLPGPLPTFVQPGRSVPPRQPDQILVAHLKIRNDPAHGTLLALRSPLR